jgi:hypothetical protein
MTDDELTKAINHLLKLYTIVNRSASFYNFSIDMRVPTRDNRTKNFIHFHSVYKKYYFANYLKAREEGYHTP